MAEKHSARLAIGRVSAYPAHPVCGQSYMEIEAHWRDAKGKAHGATIRVSMADYGAAISGLGDIPCEMEVQ